MRHNCFADLCEKKTNNASLILTEFFGRFKSVQVGSRRFKTVQDGSRVCVLFVEELRTPDGLDEFRKALEALLAASGCHGLSQITVRIGVYIVHASTIVQLVDKHGIMDYDHVAFVFLFLIWQPKVLELRFFSLCWSRQGRDKAKPFVRKVEMVQRSTLMRSCLSIYSYSIV